jgi:hypothetical protein
MMGTGVHGSGMVGCGPSSGGITTCSSLFTPALVAPCLVADVEDVVSDLSLIVTVSYSTMRDNVSLFVCMFYRIMF